MKQSEMIAWARRKKKEKVVQKKKATTVSLINKPIAAPAIADTSVISQPFEVATMVNGKVSTSPHYQSDRTLFNQQGTNRSGKTAKAYRKLKRTTEQNQKPPRTQENKHQKLSAIDPTTNKSLKGVRTEFDHIVSLSEMGRAVSAPSEYAPESVHKKWKVREGGTTNLSPEQMTGLYLTKHSQLTSKDVNQAKSNKRLHQYTKKDGWGAKSTFNPQRQAQRYHDSLLEVAQKFGKRGLFSRENSQAYREITGKEPNPLLDGDNPEFSPPSTKQNITGFDTYGDNRKTTAFKNKFSAIFQSADQKIKSDASLEAFHGRGKEAARVKSIKQLPDPIPSTADKLVNYAKKVVAQKKDSDVRKNTAKKKKEGKPAVDQSNPISQESTADVARHMYYGKSAKEVKKEVKQAAKIKRNKAHLKSIGGKWANLAGKLPKGAGGKTKKSAISGAVWDPKKFDRYKKENKVRYNPNIN